MKRIQFRYVIFLWLILFSSARGELVTLYSGSGLPAAEPWLVFGTTSLLSGALRTYTSPSLPYTLPNYVYFGDNTTSASGSFLQGFIRLESNLSSVPEPSSMILASVFGIGCCAARRIRMRSKVPIGSKV